MRNLPRGRGRRRNVAPNSDWAFLGAQVRERAETPTWKWELRWRPTLTERLPGSPVAERPWRFLPAASVLAPFAFNPSPGGREPGRLRRVSRPAGSRDRPTPLTGVPERRGGLGVHPWFSPSPPSCVSCASCGHSPLHPFALSAFFVANPPSPSVYIRVHPWFPSSPPLRTSVTSATSVVLSVAAGSRAGLVSGRFSRGQAPGRAVARATARSHPARYSSTSAYSSSVWAPCWPAPRVTVGTPPRLK